MWMKTKHDEIINLNNADVIFFDHELNGQYAISVGMSSGKYFTLFDDYYNEDSARATLETIRDNINFKESFRREI